MPIRRRLVVIGGDAAGMSAASQAKRLDKTLDVVAFERGPHTSYSACGMPYFVGDLVHEERALIARTPEAFIANGIDARVLHEVEDIDLREQRVRVRSLDSGATFREPYDELLIATGALPVRPNLPGIDASNIFTLSTLQDGIRVRAYVDETRPSRAVVVGGGYIGLEMAEAFVSRGIETTMVEQLPEVMSTLDLDMGHLVSDAVRAASVHLLLDERVESFDTKNSRAISVVTDQRMLQADIIVLGIGVRPNTELAISAGIPLGISGAIWVDDRQRTQIDHVWAAGDCAESTHLVSGRPVHIALGTVANKHGRVCGINLGGGSARFPGVLGTSITKIGEIEVARTGLNETEASEAGFDFASATIKSTTRSGYFPGTGRITIKLVTDRGSGRILGAQIVGASGSGKRIDTLAVAITAGMTVSEFEYLDLSYAPPFSPVWDPTQIAAHRSARNLSQQTAAR